jgi:hypothetical protein
VTVVCEVGGGRFQGGHDWRHVTTNGHPNVHCLGCDVRYWVGDRRLYAVLREMHPEHARTIGFLELVGTTAMSV